MLQGHQLSAWPRNVGLSLEHGSVEPLRMLFGDVGVVTCLRGFSVSGGVNKVRRGRRFVPVDFFQWVHHEVAASLCAHAHRGV